ncbi:MAG: cytochrome c oxidase subunit II, partial [Pseudomonas sp.]|nr:cytochrome c oxidase subunit II [Pseudomonas sp.]
EIYDLHMLMMYVILVVFCAVFGVMFYSIYAHRKSVGHKAEQFHENTTVEIIWTVIPFLILVGMAWPATKTLIAFKDTSNPDITIKATGYQWKWGYDYIKGEGEGIAFLSNLATPQDQIHNLKPKGENYLLEVDNPLVVPVGTKVRFLITGADVIHSWWVPALAVKKDAIPGFVNESWTRIDKPGVYRGQCTELCGKDHGFMPIVVDARSKEDFAKWLAARKDEALQLKELTSKEWTREELMARGEKTYQTTCAACHQAEGQGLPPMFPALKGSKIATGPKEGHLGLVFNGKPGTAMAAFGKQLSEVDIAAVITYERNAWGNAMNDMVTPKDVLALKQAQE